MRLTQVHRAVRQLGIPLIPAYSPEARGRSERVFRTLQDRLPKELALAGITEMAAANAFLRNQFVPAYNPRVAVPASEAGTAFTPWIGTSLAEILCVHDERGVAKDNTVRYQSRSLPIPQDPHWFHDVKVTVRVHEYPDGTWAVFQEPRCLAHYRTEGQRIEAESASPRRSGAPSASDHRPIGAPGARVRVDVSARD